MRSKDICLQVTLRQSLQKQNDAAGVSQPINEKDTERVGRHNPTQLSHESQVLLKDKTSTAYHQIL